MTFASRVLRPFYLFLSSSLTSASHLALCLFLFYLSPYPLYYCLSLLFNSFLYSPLSTTSPWCHISCHPIASNTYIVVQVILNTVYILITHFLLLELVSYLSTRCLCLEASRDLETSGSIRPHGPRWTVQ